MKKFGAHDMKKMMLFAQGLKKRLINGENSETFFEQKLPFHELEVLQKALPTMERAAGLSLVDVVNVNEEKLSDFPQAPATSVPRCPTFQFSNP